jgi:PKD repeat protein
LAASIAAGTPVAARQRPADDNKKPSVAFKATPQMGFAPLKVRVAVDIKGGADDYSDFYCAAVEWDWADGTTSGSSEDCDPYVAGKSAIQRRFTAEHTFQQAGNYDVAFRLKQKSRVVGLSKGMVRVKSGLEDDDSNQ